MPEIFLSSFALGSLMEMGDKTQLLVLSLILRFRTPWPILIGLLFSALFSNSIASIAGSWLHFRVPSQLLEFFLAVVFVGFGLWSLKPDTEKNSSRSIPRLGPFWSSFLLSLIAEFGDKSQLATAALAARFHSPILVTAGTSAGVLAVNGLVASLGIKFFERLQMKRLRWISAGFCFALSALSVINGVSSSLAGKN